MEHYKFFQNRECEYFPCHNGIPAEDFSCLFCFCPLYPLGENCGGNCSFTEAGIKDCSNCLRPHIRGNYEQILERMEEVMEIAKKESYCGGI